MSRIDALIEANLSRVRGRIESACRRAGRKPASVRLVAVTKSAAVPWIEALLAHGICDFGESRPQQLVERAALLGPSARWHLIGALQRNKVRKILPLAAYVHSVDTRSLMARIGDVALEFGLRPRVLLEVNISGENSKHGFRGDELIVNWTAISAVPNVDISGLMTMAPLADSPEAVRHVFAGLARLRDELKAKSPRIALPELSMGMSGDFEIAIEEGATMVRVGTSLFEGLTMEPPND